MASLRFKQEDYPAVADFMITSFERDLADFKSKYKTMGPEYLAEFKASNQAVKKAPSGMYMQQLVKDQTKELYDAADVVKADIILLKDYAQRGESNPKMIDIAVRQLSRRNIEAGIKTVCDSLPYYTNRTEDLADMPEGFLEKLATDTDNLETLNIKQDQLINERKLSTAHNKELYKTLNKYISEVSRAGKIIYKGLPKSDEYTISKILSRLGAANQTKTGASAAKK